MQFKTVNLPVRLKKTVLALGADVKNTLCFASGKTAHLSAPLGDLKDPASFVVFEKTIKNIHRYFKSKPQVIACDLHPEYFSVKHAGGFLDVCRVVRVQHHHAHIVSCMAENGVLDKKVIGVAFDGAGFGDDGTFWGAEFLICGYSSYQRMGYLKQISLVGGERAILEPWRTACAWLYSIYGDAFLKLGIEFTDKVSKSKWPVLKSMLKTGLNSPLASSMGRLFDAAGALVLRQYESGFEAEAAIGLEKCAASCASLNLCAYKFKIVRQDNHYVIDPGPAFRMMVFDIKRKQEAGVIAYRFHLTVAAMIEKMCLLLRKETGINKVVLSGGVFQNQILLNKGLYLLRQEKFEVFTHNVLSCSDTGISLGQAVVAGSM